VAPSRIRRSGQPSHSHPFCPPRRASLADRRFQRGPASDKHSLEVRGEEGPSFVVAPIGRADVRPPLRELPGHGNPPGAPPAGTEAIAFTSALPTAVHRGASQVSATMKRHTFVLRPSRWQSTFLPAGDWEARSSYLPAAIRRKWT